MLDMTRNQFFMIGMVLLLLGIEFRLVERVELTPECTQILFKQTSSQLASGASSLLGLGTPVVKKTIPIPDAVGWGLLCAGGVLVLHSWAMRKPEG